MTPKNSLQQSSRFQTSDGNPLDIFKIAKNIDLEKIGHYSGVKSQVDNMLIQVMIAGAMIKNNITNEGAICVRPLMPIYDFILYNDSSPKDNTWKININKNRYYQGSPVDQYIYRTDETKTHMKYKCMIFTGLNYNATNTCLDEVSIWRTGTRLIDRFIIDHNNDANHNIEFWTPIIIGQARNTNSFGIAIKLTQDPPDDTEEKIKIIGYVAEPLGVPIID